MKKLFKVQLHVFSIFFMIILLYSCASAKVTLFGETYPPKGEDTVIDVYSTNKPSISYKEIAKITCGDTSESWNIKQILKKAREIGADGVIIIGKAGTMGVGVPIGNLTYIASEDYGIAATAIKYNAP